MAKIQGPKEGKLIIIFTEKSGFILSPWAQNYPTVSRSESGTPWYSKNCEILNTQPKGSEPSNLGTSSLSMWGEGVWPW